MTKMTFAIIAVFTVLLGLGGWGLQRARAENQRLTDALTLWKNCPLPHKGNSTLVETEWPGQLPGQKYRCLHLKPGRSAQPLGTLS